MEYWDLYDYYGNKKRKKAIRGTKLNNDDFHLVINAWIVNDKGEFLITQRSPKKSHPLMWECTGGSSLMGENSLEAAIREVKEELGIDIECKNAVFIGETRRFYYNCPDILHVWLFKSNVDIDNVRIQKEEVNDVMWASSDKILQLFKEGKFEANSFFYKVIKMHENCKKYYIGFNAGNAICNENFIDGAITLNPNKEKGNIYYTKKNIENKSSKDFLDSYKKFIIENMENITEKNKNVIFFAFNKKIKDLLKDEHRFNVIGENDYSLIECLNDKKYTRELLKEKVPIISMKWVASRIDYAAALKLVGSNRIVLQGKTGSGGNNTFYIDSKEKYDRYSLTCTDGYYLSKYVEHLPLNITIIVGKDNNVILPPSVQLIKLNNDRFQYVGADFIYSQSLNDKVRNQVYAYSNTIINELKKKKFKGILGIDYIVDSEDNVYFMEINPRFQASSFIINKYLIKYCCTSIAELHYLAISENCIGNTYLNKIDNSFLNCTNIDEYSKFEHYKTLKKGYYARNKSSCFRKIYAYSIVKCGDFEKRQIDK